MDMAGAGTFIIVGKCRLTIAGNPQLNFGSGRGAAWLALSVAVFAGACFTLLGGSGASALARIRGAGAA